MGYSYAADMINRMKQERSRNAQNKKRAYSINNVAKLDNEKSGALNFIKVSPDKMATIKVEIHNKIRRERKKKIIISVISIIIALLITFNLLKFIFI
ncbi:hypothetical protein [Lacinutrix sp. Bg11-31]|uniref:hypothetical protein n=1 Tax=Lacinutrix sp. Bg11-31 TaxID=2057808 RepID=UPI000C30A46E|nr:hypothetical protein [Lacinutrix sp. Bg11-31]AUC83094.1 hypothetical protein CW733_13525 [Lacinutrix sp. Bg11-31]